MSRTGVLLAAGFGSRLAGTNSGTDSKPLTIVAGVPLVIRAIQSLETAGCDKIVVVLGYEPDAVRKTIQQGYKGSAEVAFVLNARFDLQNGVSVLAARPHLNGQFILMMADHIVDDDTMERARLHEPKPGSATVLVDYKLKSVFDMADATKILELDNRVDAIGKNLPSYNCVDTGVFVCTRGLVDCLEDIYQADGDASLTDGVRKLAARDLMYTLDIGAGFWQDVDTPEMLRHAESKLSNNHVLL